MIEAGVLLDTNNQPIYWHLPPGRTGASLPDSRTLWDVIWENRHKVGGFAHTHPWNGEPLPSGTDISTFHAIELALGKHLKWWVVTMDRVGSWEFDGQSQAFEGGECQPSWPSWIDRLRDISRGDLNERAKPLEAYARGELTADEATQCILALSGWTPPKDAIYVGSVCAAPEHEMTEALLHKIRDQANKGQLWHAVHLAHELTSLLMKRFDQALQREGYGR